MSGVDERFGDRVNVIWLPEVSEQGRAAKALFDLPERGLALLNGSNRLVWRTTSGTRLKVEQQIRQVLQRE